MKALLGEVEAVLVAVRDRLVEIPYVKLLKLLEHWTRSTVLPITFGQVIQNLGTVVIVKQAKTHLFLLTLLTKIGEIEQWLVDGVGLLISDQFWSDWDEAVVGARSAVMHTLAGLPSSGETVAMAAAGLGGIIQEMGGMVETARMELELTNFTRHLTVILWAHGVLWSKVNKYKSTWTMHFSNFVQFSQLVLINAFQIPIPIF